jgi:hypothetical protein
MACTQYLCAEQCGRGRGTALAGARSQLTCTRTCAERSEPQR